MVEGLANPMMYFTCFLVVVIALLPRYTVKAAIYLFHPDDIAKARLFEHWKSKAEVNDSQNLELESRNGQGEKT